jgi:hypothetical protein
MRATMFILALFSALYVGACRHAKIASLSAGAQHFAASSFTSTPKTPDFETDLKPIFQARCQPCHFQGGKVYDKMPFDRPETITRLGAKLFTRIKDEKEQRLIREFLSQP